MKLRIFYIFLMLFLFVLPIPGTIALRHVLLLGSLALMISLWREYQLGWLPKDQKIKGVMVWLVILSIWLLAQALWISDETTWALEEISAQWLPALFSAVLGVGAVSVAQHTGLPRKKLLGGLVLVLLAQVVFSLVVTFPDFLASGVFPQTKTELTAGKLEISYWNNVLLVFLAVDGLSRWLYQRSITSLPTPILIGAIIVVFLSNLAFGARNGMIGSLFLLSSLALLVLWHEREKVGNAKALGFLGGALVLIGFLAWSNYQLDPRWEAFEETAQIAWQGSGSDAWLHPDDVILPMLKSGDPVETSAYLRVAWIRAGLDLIPEYPYGVGYGRNAFGHALRKTMETRLGHSHSGLLDWTLGVGLPGLLFWLGFLSWLAWVGVRRYFVGQDPAGLILTFVVSGFFGRMLLDSINRDHMLMVFFLIFTILVSLPEEPIKQ